MNGTQHDAAAQRLTAELQSDGWEVQIVNQESPRIICTRQDAQSGLMLEIGVIEESVDETSLGLILERMARAWRLACIEARMAAPHTVEATIHFIAEPKQ